MKQIKGFDYGLLIILIMLVISLFVGFLANLLSLVIPINQSWIGFFSFVISVVLTLYIATRIWGSSKFECEKTNILVFVILIPAILSMAIITEGLASFIPMPDIVKQFFEKAIHLDFPGFLTVAIAAPILEELIFRGVLLKNFLKKYSVTKAIVLSALLFGIAHLNPWQFVGGFVMGIMMGWVYYKTKSVITVIFIHFVNNSFSFYLGKKYNDINVSTANIVGGSTNYILLIIGAILICVICYFALNKLFFKKHIV